MESSLVILLPLLALVTGYLLAYRLESAKRKPLETELSSANTEIQLVKQRADSLDREIALCKREIETRSLEIERLRRDLLEESKDRSRFEELARQVPVLESRIESKDEVLKRAGEEITAQRERLAEIETAREKEAESMAEKLRLLEEAEARLKITFDSLSKAALEQSNRSFLDLAKGTLEKLQKETQGDIEKRHQNLTDLLKPLQDSLTKVDGNVREIEKARVGAYSELRQHLTTLQEHQQTLRLETEKLNNALRAPQTRGRWGEIQLRRVVELAGMQRHCDFYEQTGLDDGRLRPDLVVKLPGNKSIVVDAKAPWTDAYVAAINASAEDQSPLLDNYASLVKSHIISLGQKKYWDALEHAPEFVILFLPAESMLYAALRSQPQLIEEGITEKVILATPTTLIALLKSASYGWRQEQIAENAKEIRDLGAELYKRIKTVGESFNAVGRSLNQAVSNYNSSVASLESRLLPGARKFRDLGVATAEKEMSELTPIDLQARIVQSPELLAAGPGEQLPLE